MATTVKLESESVSDIDPLSTNNENDISDIKREKYLLPVVMTESEVGFVRKSILSHSVVCHVCVCLYMINRNCVLLYHSKCVLICLILQLPAQLPLYHLVSKV
jgi:hypothetical protein